MTLTRRQLVLLAALTLMWGLNWPMMKFSLRELSPLHFRAITMSGGTLTLLLVFALRGVDLRLSRANAWRVAVLALPNIIGWHLCSIIGLAQLPTTGVEAARDELLRAHGLGLRGAVLAAPPRARRR